MLVVCADLYKMKVELHILTQTSMKEEFLMIFSPNKGNFRDCCRSISNKTRIETLLLVLKLAVRTKLQKYINKTRIETAFDGEPLPKEQLEARRKCFDKREGGK